MKLDTRFKLLKKDYRNIRDDNKTLDQIWNKKGIPLEDRISICVDNEYYDNLKKITSEELNGLLVKCKNDSFNNFWHIICIMYVKNDYSLIPSLENDDIKEYLVVNEKMLIPSMAFIFMWAKNVNNINDRNENNIECTNSINRILERKAESFINAVENEGIIREGFLSYIRENSSFYLSCIISRNHQLEEYFCKDHPELYFDIVYNVKNNNNNLLKNLSFYLKANLLKYLKGENRFLMIYYTPAYDVGDENANIVSVFQSLFNLDYEEALYVKSLYSIQYKEYLLRTNEIEPGFIRKIINLEEKCKTKKMIRLVYRYKGTDFIKELMDFDVTTLTNEEYSIFVKKINELISKPRLSDLNSVDMLNNKSIKELEKGGYEISKESANSEKIYAPTGSEGKKIFGDIYTIIKIYPNGKIKDENSPNDHHLSMIEKVNSDEPELNVSHAVGSIMFAMALKGHCVILTEGNALNLVMPNQDELTLEQIDTIKRLLESIKIPNIIITYGFVITNNSIEEYSTDNVETVLDVLEAIYNQKKNNTDMSQKM